MKKDDLLALVNVLPDDADIQVEESELYDTNDIGSVVPAAEYRNWWNAATREQAIKDNVWVLMTK